MLAANVLLIIVCFFSSAIVMAQETATEPNTEESEEDAELEDDQSSLDYSQWELFQLYKRSARFGMGTTGPWHFYSLAGEWHYQDNLTLQFALGGGGFELSGKAGGKTVQIDIASRSINFGVRHYFTEKALLFYEPIVGLNFWSGRVQPLGTDNVSDVAASALTSDFSHRGVTLGLKTGMQWIFQNQVSIEFAILQLSHSFLLGQTYTNNTQQVRDGVRSQIGSSKSWSGLNLSVGYRFE
ncbi:MAG: hypothetical protein HRU19_17330 [Pseudobacteriovorax sp.]|nr:hypothetical protein [Pseudobacteriovorax sp.]